MFEAFTLKSQEVEEKEDKLRLSVRELEDSDRMNFHKALSDRMKDPDTYAVLNFFFITGIHHFYLENHAQGSINLIGFVLGLLLLLGGLDGPWEAGISLIVFIILIELPALFRSQIIVKKYRIQTPKSIFLSAFHRFSKAQSIWSAYHFFMERWSGKSIWSKLS